MVLHFEFGKNVNLMGKPSGKYEYTSLKGGDVKKVFRKLPDMFSTVPRGNTRNHNQDMKGLINNVNGQNGFNNFTISSHCRTFLS